MRFLLVKKGIAIVLALISVLNISLFTIDDIARWIAGPGYTSAEPEEKAEMLLDLYMNQDFLYLEADAERFAREVLTQVILEIMCSGGDGSKIVEAINDLPVYDRNGRDTTRASYTPDKDENLRFKATLRKFIEISPLDDNVKNGLYYFTDGINDLCIYFITTDYEGVYEFAGDYISDTGTVQVGYTGIYYDSNTTLVYGCNDNGIMQIGFDFKADTITMQNPVHPWQRQFGYNVFFDVIGNFVLIDTDTVRVRFMHQGREKMIQFWKGNYTRISNGAEIGIYNQHEDSVLLYDSVPDEEMLYMSMKIYHGDELIFENDRELHWWLTGYQPGPLIPANELTLDCSIEFTDADMFNAFLASANEAFADEEAQITADGLTVHIIWK